MKKQFLAMAMPLICCSGVKERKPYDAGGTHLKIALAFNAAHYPLGR